MPKKLLTLLLPAIIMSLSSSITVASEKYPAANFEPTIIYSNQDYQETSNNTSSRKTSKADANYPAANFEPKVVYLDDKYTSQSKVDKRETSKPDPKYPAANFEPKVIYP